MANIHILDTALINKIAAGEVIERPASVVKELVENSIDAGASSITVEIKDGGISQIRVTDNGCGIAPDEVKTAFLRHATSKLESFDDLTSILTLGFRGEALASIAGVSQLELTTRVKHEDSAVRIEIHGGNVLSEERIGANEGTTFVVKNLFYNTPARRKFLKKPAAESGHISDIINKIALGHPHISIKLINNGNTVVHTSGNNDLKTAVFYIYGRQAAEKMLPVNISKNSFTLKGLIGRPELNRGNRSYENFFVNSRYIKSDIVQRAAEDAYRGRLMVGKFPVFVIDLTVPANTVDVNVHPAKLEVRFSDEEFIYNLVKKVFEDALSGEESLIPEVKPDKDAFKETTGAQAYRSEKQRELEEILLEEEFYEESETKENKISDNKDMDEDDLIAFEAIARASAGIPPEDDIIYETEDNLLFVREDVSSVYENAENESFDDIFDKLYPSKEDWSDILVEDISNINTAKETFETDTQNNISQSTQNQTKRAFFNKYKIIGQIFNTYWIVEQAGSMFMIDQHAAHERILYERLLNSVKEGSAVSQKLVQPVAVNLSVKEMEIVRQNLKLFEDFGFELEEFGETVYAIRAVPIVFKSPVSPSFFVELVDMLTDKKAVKNVYETKLDVMATMSCKAAVKGNDKLSFIEAKELIERLLELDNPFSCPHGRPTVVEMGKYEIEKMFKRIQN